MSDTHELITDAVTRGRRITPAAEWFLDNFYLIEEQIRAARRHLPRAYSRELPRLINDPSSGYPRVYSIALELISHADGRVDGESLRAFVTAYQSVKSLRLGELWAIPIMLRMALLENLRRVASRITRGRTDREHAAIWIEHMLNAAAKDPTKTVLALADMVKADPQLTNAFVAEFASQLHGQGSVLIFAMTWLEQRLAEQGQTIDHVFQQAGQNQAADQVSIGNSIGSLRFLGATDWRDFVESMSVVEGALSTDPTGVYTEMDFATRDRYRHAVEEIAKRSARSEEEVARKAIELAREGANGIGPDSQPSHHEQESHVGYYLTNKGRRALERSLQTPASLVHILPRVAGHFPLTIYLGSIVLLTLALTAIILWWAAQFEITAWALGISFPFVVACASQLAVTIVHRLSPFLTHPRILPRMDYSEGIPPEHRTVVAVPALLSDIQEVDDLLNAMEVRYLANIDANLSFALIADFRDAPQERMSEDKALLERASHGIKLLNARYGGGQDATELGEPAEISQDEIEEGAKIAMKSRGPFSLFHRPRRWNAQENLWMGWERKRGKLEQFNAALRGDQSGFDTIIGDVDRLNGIKYVIALDSDTQLPRDSAHQLVGTMAHPLNRPRYDPKLERVVAGYSILQPRIGISMPSANRSTYSRAFAGEPGIDPYTRAVSDIYQDVFEEGSFIGKGIYDVDALQQSIGGRFPENRILSHDLLEGAHARSGLVSDIVLFEDYPSSYRADIIRRHRWVRGDWQIASWLLGRVPGFNGDLRRNPISGLSRWKILDNLRRSLLPAAVFILLIFGWFIPSGALLFTLLVVGTLLLPTVLSAVTDFVRRPADLPRSQHARSSARSFLRQLFRDAFALACLPYEAYVGADAIVRTLVRLLCTRQKLLEWRTSIDAQRNARTDLTGFVLSMWLPPVAAVLGLISLSIVRIDALIVAAPISLLWLAAPYIAWRLSRPIVPARPRLSLEDLLLLRGLARRTWRFFETFVGPEDNYLPPDNFQEDPPQGIAHRTSPTNIGLSLLASLAAYDFGYISVGEVIGRTRRTLDTINRLQGHRGHLFNWYDTRTLDPLRPLYVSTVDSGNLVGHLLTLASGLQELAEQPLFRAEVISGLEDTLQVASDMARRSEDGRTSKVAAPVSSDVIGRLSRLREILRDRPQTLSTTRLLLERLRSGAADLSAGVQSHSELVPWVRAFEDQCRFAIEELDHLAPWVDLSPPVEQLWEQANEEQVRALKDLQNLLQRLDHVPTIAETAHLQMMLVPAVDALGIGGGRDEQVWPAEVQAWLTRLRSAGEAASERATHRLSELRALAIRCTELADIGYEFLYDKERHLLAIGYNVADHRLDAGFYDLLASEARLVSYVAVAQGKLPQEHWFSLGRLLTNAGGKAALLSWSGSMFEYLMPLLVMPTYDRTLLDDTYRAVVRRQIEYGRQRGVPWGISESGLWSTGPGFQTWAGRGPRHRSIRQRDGPHDRS
ncbi:MAG: hypothetical protein L0219_02885 [Phycisphaerales bacterium]|nr:hypothetical protein [Phycisphaerales bacterium]